MTYYFIISIPFLFQNSSQNEYFFSILLIVFNILFSLMSLYSLENKIQYSDQSILVCTENNYLWNK